ncbi:MAG TPA: protein kinase [Gemmatimonadales bacterium]|nr:protein kinase [Gemmatimonadales bacterium]
MPDLSPGARFGAYRLIRPLGKGGFAEVWEAESEANGRRVALKVLTELRAESARALERFQQEGRLAASLHNSRCVYVFDAGAHDGFPYIAMELVTGGTLADRIRDGPLPPRAAVDVVLDVLEGLESAHQREILHRDVKPSNVFLDADGRAKIGDFGISKSLEVDSHLSQTGAFLGTPFYASPEQIAAEPLDLRSDLYSVGAMLYELVTGKLPYQGTNASAVLAQVLTRDPVPFAQHDVAVPPGLQRVILRLLAKSKEKRFQSYEQLREALVPLSSKGLAPAGLARRFGAIAVDLLLFAPLGVALSAAAMTQAVRGGLLLAGLAQPLAQLVYFALTERYWGGSVGKRLLGLRVTGADGSQASLGRVTWRAAVFLLLYAGPGLLYQFLTTVGLDLISHPVLRFAPGLLQLLAIGVLVSTMRRRNGYAGAHELASGTRTMAVLARERATPVPRVAPAVEPVPAATAYGPYRVTGTLWRDPAAALLVAHDDELHRDVWIHEVRDAAAAPPVERLRGRGEGSLPWLQRGTRDGVTWDAYGAPQGTTLEDWALSRRGLGWREMREVLHSLARELESRFARDGTAGPLSPGQVWIEPSGRALLLDVPVESPRSAAEEERAVEVTPATWRDFLRRIVTTRFQRTGIPLPEYAQGIVASLSGGDGPGSASRTIADFRAALEGVAARPAEVSRGRRAGMLAVVACVPGFVVAIRLAVPVMMASMPAWYRDVSVYSEPYLRALRHADSTVAAGSGDSTARRTAEAVRVVFAAAMHEARSGNQTSTPLLAALPPELRGVLDSAARRYPAPDSQAVAAARAWLDGRVTLPNLGVGLATVPKAVLQSLTALAFLGAAGAVLALLLRGGVLFRLFGIAVVRADGVPAGRLRCAARSLVAWSPLLLLLALASAPHGVSVGIRTGTRVTTTTTDAPPADDGRVPLWVRWTLFGIALAGAGVALWRPTRGVAERASGVVLVPR